MDPSLKEVGLINSLLFPSLAEERRPGLCSKVAPVITAFFAIVET